MDRVNCCTQPGSKLAALGTVPTDYDVAGLKKHLYKEKGHKKKQNKIFHLKKVNKRFTN